MIDEIYNAVTEAQSSQSPCYNKTDGPGRIFTPVGSFGVLAFVTYAMPIVIFLGLVGNIFSFVILKESAHRVSSHLYLICLAVFDSFSLLTMIPGFWAVLLLRPYYHMTNPHITWVEKYLMTWGFCQARLFFTFFCRTLSIWTIVLFTLERFVAVVFPMKGEMWCTVKSAIISMSVMGFVALFSNMPWFFAFTKHTVPCSGGRVICKGNSVLFINRMIEVLCLSIIPAVIICACNIAIVLTLRRRQAHLTLHDKEAADTQQRMITRRLLAVSTAFVVLTSPFLIIVSIHTAYEVRKEKGHKSGALADVFHLCFLMFTINLAINFVLYCLTGPTFRRAAINLALCRVNRMQHYRRRLSDVTSSETGPRTGMSDVHRSESGSRGEALLPLKSNSFNAPPKPEEKARARISSVLNDAGMTTAAAEEAAARSVSLRSDASSWTPLVKTGSVLRKETSI